MPLNKRAEMWGRMKEWLVGGSIPKDRERRWKMLKVVKVMLRNVEKLLTFVKVLAGRC